MDKQGVMAKLQFRKYLVESIDFKLNEQYEPTGQEVEVDFGLKHKLALSKQNHQAVLWLECVVFENYIEHNLPFYLRVSVVGYFDYKADLDGEKLEKMLRVNGTAILFPYIRTMVSTITSLSSLPPLILPTINVHRLLEQKEQGGSPGNG